MAEVQQISTWSRKTAPLSTYNSIKETHPWSLSENEATKAATSTARPLLAVRYRNSLTSQNDKSFNNVSKFSKRSQHTEKFDSKRSKKDSKLKLNLSSSSASVSRIKVKSVKLTWIIKNISLKSTVKPSANNTLTQNTLFQTSRLLLWLIKEVRTLQSKKLRQKRSKTTNKTSKGQSKC